MLRYYYLLKWRAIRIRRTVNKLILFEDHWKNLHWQRDNTLNLSLLIMLMEQDFQDLNQHQKRFWRNVVLILISCLMESASAHKEWLLDTRIHLIAQLEILRYVFVSLFQLPFLFLGMLYQLFQLLLCFDEIMTNYDFVKWFSDFPNFVQMLKYLSSWFPLVSHHKTSQNASLSTFLWYHVCFIVHQLL